MIVLLVYKFLLVIVVFFIDNLKFNNVVFLGSNFILEFVIFEFVIDFLVFVIILLFILEIEI